jgi:peptidoglycan hydrolase-like protein with peptidoglycan-binding domain
MRIVLGVLALLFGIFFAGCEIFGTYEFLLKDQQGLTYIVFAGSGIAAAVSLLPIWATLAWRERKGLSTAIWALFVASLFIVVCAAIARTGSATDQAQFGAEKSVETHSEAIAARVAAEQDVAQARSDLADARRDVTENAAKKTCASNCADLLAKAVSNAEAALVSARLRLDAARSDIVSAPPAKTDGLSKRIAALFPYVTEGQVRLYQPIFVPVVTSALSAVLTALGLWALTGVAHRTKPDGISVRPIASDAMPVPLAVAQSIDIGASEAPLAIAAPADSGAHDVPLADDPPADSLELIEPAPQPLQISGPPTPVSPFVASRIARDPASDVHLRDARVAYMAFCAAEDATPVELPSFVRELANLCKRHGIQVRTEGRDAFLVGARLVDHASG